MDSIAPPETFGLGGVEYAVADLRGPQTYGEVVIGWLDVIYQSVDEKTRVRLIGTHLDKVRQLIRSFSLDSNKLFIARGLEALNFQFLEKSIFVVHGKNLFFLCWQSRFSSSFLLQVQVLSLIIR